MSTKVREKNFVIRMTKTFREAGAHVQRIEDAYSKGIPDVNICLPTGREIWLEAKVVELPVRSTTPVRLHWTPEQRLWASDRRRVGGEVWCIARYRRKGVLLLRPDVPDLPLEELQHRADFDGGVEELVRRLVDGLL